MIFMTKENGQKLLFRCACTHDFTKDLYKYLTNTKGKLIMNAYYALQEYHPCPDCEFFGWRIESLSEKELTERDRI